MEDGECQELQCSVCILDYSDHRVPRNLICGHSVCTSCLDALIREDRRCPECRTSFEENKASQLPVNYPLLRMSRLIAHAKTDPNVFPELQFPLTCPSSGLRQNAGECSIHDSTLFFMCISCSVWVCHECVEVQHLDPPRGKCFIVSVEDAIEKLKALHTKNLEAYIDEAGELQHKKKKAIETFTGAVKCLQFQSQGCGSECSADILYYENHKNASEAFVVSLDETRTDMNTAKNRISDSITPQELTESMKLSNDCQASFEKLMNEENTREIPDLSISRLLRGKGLKELLEEGNPVFVQKDNCEKWAKIVLKNDKLHLYSLRDGCPPEEGICLPFNSVRELVPKESPMLFMEIGWGSEESGAVKGTAYVQLFGDTPRGRNAIFLCSGEVGKSYRNAPFLKVTKEGDTPHQILGGDYINNGGMGTFPVVSGIEFSNEYVHELKAGIFFGVEYSGDADRMSLFSVCLTDSQSEKVSSAFGYVEEGLDVFKEAASLTDVTEASVVDCGLIISNDNQNETGNRINYVLISAPLS